VSISRAINRSGKLFVSSVMEDEWKLSDSTEICSAEQVQPYMFEPTAKLATSTSTGTASSTVSDRSSLADLSSW
jgi:hypothetical protein